MPASLNPILAALQFLLMPKSLNAGEDEEIARTKKEIMQERANAILDAIEKRDIITKLPGKNDPKPLI